MKGVTVEVCDFKLHLEVYSQCFSQLYLCPYIYGHTDKFPPPFPCKCMKAFISLSENMNLPIQKCVAENTLHNNSSMILAPSSLYYYFNYEGIVLPFTHRTLLSDKWNCIRDWKHSMLLKGKVLNNKGKNKIKN